MLHNCHERFLRPTPTNYRNLIRSLCEDLRIRRCRSGSVSRPRRSTRRVCERQVTFKPGRQNSTVVWPDSSPAKAWDKVCDCARDGLRWVESQEKVSPTARPDRSPTANSRAGRWSDERWAVAPPASTGPKPPQAKALFPVANEQLRNADTGSRPWCGLCTALFHGRSRAALRRRFRR